MTIPAIFRILAVFAWMVWLIRRRLSIGNAFVIGSATLGVVFGMRPGALLDAAASALVEPKTISLAVVVCLILVLSHSMETAGQMKRLLERFQGLMSHPGLNLITFPALIGLLPMPGGAVFSAPMVKAIGASRELSPSRLSFINYWFRHIWEYWWPLYPGVLLATAMAGVDLWSFVLCMFPLTIVAFCAGYLPIRRAIARGAPSSPENPHDHLFAPFFKELTPIVMVIVIGLGAGMAIDRMTGSGRFPVAKETGLILALLLAIGQVWISNRLSSAQRRRIWLNPELLKAFYMIVGILLFQQVLTRSQAVSAVTDELMSMNIPLVPVTLVLPFLVGGVAGITIAFVGTTFPILISLIAAYGQQQWMLAYLALGMVAGFTGVLFSPLHLCLLLSNQFFNARMGSVYRDLAVPCLLLMSSGLAYFYLLRWITG